ncbi:GDSL esterase/lipase At1g28590-like [Phragmites australis]|uniref:GDSL esterase/lipase At1g28590-like n=1 Tax=Phragmites australis TaxID=29695 RepID=UPI002D794FEC|nr:GDSL esterase/lipase At1g28590-like [Phragmites australis]
MKHIIVCLQIFLLISSFSYSIQTQYTSIFSFGDSYTDTGNAIILYGPTKPDLWMNKPPYGMTFFGHPTGRLSDGRLIIDFIAEALGLPLLPPSLAANQSFQQGANFAVAGATALNRTSSYVQGGGVKLPPINVSLSDQLGWFDAMKPSLCSSPQACKEFFAKALFVVGELGWNDYGVMLVGGKSVGEVQSYVPRLVGVICAATEKLINEGASTIVVSGVSPLGCAPGNLVLLVSQNKADYETDTGCLKNLNLLSKDHNSQLSQALTKLNARYPGVRITYADLYTPIIDFAASPDRYGFDGTDGALRTCCGGGGGKFNFNLSRSCGMPGVSACGDPSVYVNWDGVHLTEAAYHRVADGWLRGPFAHPPILSTYN